MKEDVKDRSVQSGTNHSCPESRNSGMCVGLSNDMVDERTDSRSQDVAIQPENFDRLMPTCGV